MLYDLAKRIQRVRIRHSVEQIAAGLYSTCPHWWAWWIPNGSPVWQFIDDTGVSHNCAITYGTNPTIITTSGSIVGGIWFGAPVVEVVYGSELDTRTKDADRPALYIISDYRGRLDKLSYPEGVVTAFLIVPQSAKWDARLSAQMHNGMLEAIRDIMDRAFVDILDATWVPLYNANLGSGSGLAGEANSLLLTLRWRKY